MSRKISPKRSSVTLSIGSFGQGDEIITVTNIGTVNGSAERLGSELAELLTEDSAPPK